MRELKVYKMVDKYYCDDSFCVVPSDVYLKSEADEVICHQKYKRCVAMSAYWVAVRYKCIDEKHRRQADKNNKRWLELSKRYKEAKE